MNSYRFIIAFLPLFACTLGGCSSLMQGMPLPDGFQVKELAKADAGRPFAVNRTGLLAALSKGHLQLIDPHQEPRPIGELNAAALSFSPSGEKLAAAIPVVQADPKSDSHQTMLRLFDRQGKVVGETTIPERVTSLAWRSEKELLASGLTVRKFSFGSELVSHLYRWDGTGAALSADLSDMTLRKPLSQQPEESFTNTVTLAVSPYGDEIAYSSLKAPPMFSPYLRIATRHLESGAEREVAETALDSGGPIYLPDGESLIIGNARGLSRRVTLPDGREIDAWPSQGSYPAVSPGGSYLFLDGRLYQNGRTVISFPSQARGAFLADGTGLVISYGGRLYMLTGFQDQPAPALPADLGRLLQLRKLRSMGLITEKEYRAQKVKAQQEQVAP